MKKFRDKAMQLEGRRGKTWTWKFVYKSGASTILSIITSGHTHTPIHTYAYIK